MKSTLLLATALTVALLSSPALAQTQQEQEACEGDVFNLCQDKIPDEDEIVVCLRKNWSKVSKECRRVMVRHKRNPRAAGKRATKNGAAIGGRASDY